MAEQEHVPPKKKIRVWIETILGTVGGLLSGAVVMYLSAYFDRAVKPAKPVPNFSFTVDGLTVNFQNLSNGGEGWWDFGDGSPLEPVTEERTAVAHAYARPGDYTVKMSLRNLFNEDVERSAPVRIIAAATTTSGPPEVSGVQLEPVSPLGYAPATYRLVGAVRNAQLCVLDAGENGLDVVTDPEKLRDRLLTFRRPGVHAVRLVAVNGTQQDTKTFAAAVKELPAGTIVAQLAVSDRGRKPETSVVEVSCSEMAHDLGAGNKAFEHPLTAPPGATITDAAVVMRDGRAVRLEGRKEMTIEGPHNAVDLKLRVADDRRTAVLSGKLVVSSEVAKGRKHPPTLSVKVLLTVERRTDAVQNGLGDIAQMSDKVGGVGDFAPPPGPKDWTNVQRTTKFQFWDNRGAAGPEVAVPCDRVAVTLDGTEFTATAGFVAGRVHLQLVPVKNAALRQMGN